MTTTKIGEITMDEHKADILQTLYETGNFNPRFEFTRKKDGRIALEVYAEDVPEIVVPILKVKQ